MPCGWWRWLATASLAACLAAACPAAAADGTAASASAAPRARPSRDRSDQRLLCRLHRFSRGEPCALLASQGRRCRIRANGRD
jgi:hypothetical protein